MTLAQNEARWREQKSGDLRSFRRRGQETRAERRDLRSFRGWRPFGCPATRAERSRNRREETFGPVDGGVGRPAPNVPETFGPVDGGVGRPAPNGADRTAGSGDPRRTCGRRGRETRVERAPERRPSVLWTAGSGDPRRTCRAGRKTRAERAPRTPRRAPVPVRRGSLDPAGTTDRRSPAGTGLGA